MQSSVISILVEQKPDPDERTFLKEMFSALDTNKNGYLVSSDLKKGMDKVLPHFWTILDKPNDFEPDWEKVCQCIN